MSKIPPVAQHYEEENKFHIEKDPYVGKNIVWEEHRNYSVDRKHGTKKECETWIKKQNKKRKKRVK